MGSNSSDRTEYQPSLLSETKDFTQALFHSAIENPINGLVQIVDHSTVLQLPELNIIGAPEHNSYGAMAGSIAGTAIDIVAASVATGGVVDVLGGAGLAAGAVTAAATGAVYGGILQPSDPKSETFFKDRLTNGAIGAVGFAAMAGASSLLGASGLFAEPASRSLAGSLEAGGLSGGAGGAAGAEATALFKDGKAFPSAGELLGSLGSGALFGATYAGLGYAYNHLTAPQNENESTKISTPKSESSAVSEKPAAAGTAEDGVKSPYFDKEMSNGLRMISTPDSLTSYLKDGSSEVSFPNDLLFKAPVESRVTGYDQDYQPIVEHSQQLTSTEYGSLKYSPDGSLNQALLADAAQPTVSLSRTGTDTWSVRTGDEMYSWQGQVEPVKGAGPNDVTGIKFVPAKGQPVTFDLKSGTQSVADILIGTGKFESLAPELGYARTDDAGNLILKAGSYERLVVNGTKVIGETAVQPSDVLKLQRDIGDRYPVWVEDPIPVTAADGGHATIPGLAESTTGKPHELSSLVPRVSPSGRMINPTGIGLGYWVSNEGITP